MNVKDIDSFNKLCRKEIKLIDYTGDTKLIYLCINPNYKKFYVTGIKGQNKPYKNTISEFIMLLKELQHNYISHNKMLNFLKEQDFQSFEAYKNILEKKLLGIFRLNTIQKVFNLDLPPSKPKKLDSNVVVIHDDNETFYYNMNKKLYNIVNNLITYVKKVYRLDKFRIILDKQGKIIEISYLNGNKLKYLSK